MQLCLYCITLLVKCVGGVGDYASITSLTKPLETSSCTLVRKHCWKPPARRTRMTEHGIEGSSSGGGGSSIASRQRLRNVMLMPKDLLALCKAPDDKASDAVGKLQNNIWHGCSDCSCANERWWLKLCDSSNTCWALCIFCFSWQPRSRHTHGLLLRRRLQL